MGAAGRRSGEGVCAPLKAEQLFRDEPWPRVRPRASQRTNGTQRPDPVAEGLRICRLGNGRAFDAYLDLPRSEDDRPLVSNGKQLVFTGTPGRIRYLEDRLVIPSSARVFLMYYKPQSLSLGRPSDVTGRIVKEENAKPLAVRLRNDLYDMTGVVTKMARPEQEAILDLVYGAGIHASVAAGILRDAKQFPDEEHRYLVKTALPMSTATAGTYFSPEENNATAKLNMAPPTQYTEQFFDPAQLDQQGRALAAGVNAADGDLAKDRKMMEEVLVNSNFRDITSDMVRQCTLNMDIMGQLLLRILLHLEEYEDRFGQEDAERLRLKARDTFFNDGDMALFLREKRGSGGERDDEGALADLLSADMGSSGGGVDSVGGV